MYDRDVGCRTIGCFAGALLILIFFGMLLSLTQNLAAKKKRQVSPGAGVPGYVAPNPVTGAPSNADMEDAMNIFRLPELVNAARNYAADNGGKLPPMDAPDVFRAAVFPKYVTDAAIFQSPNSGLPYFPNPALSGKPLASFQRPGEVIAFYQPMPAQGPGSEKPRAIIFLSGAPREVSAAEWRRYREQMTAPSSAPISAPAPPPPGRTP